MRMKIQTKNIRQVGSQTFLAIYFCIYILRIVSKWEDEKEKRADDCWASLITCPDEDPYSDGRTLNVCTCCILNHMLLWHQRSWGLARAEFPRLLWKHYIHLGVFVVHVNMFTVAGHSPLINIELFFLLYLLKSFNSSKHVLLLYFNFCFSC